MRYIRCRTLAEWLGFTPETVKGWANSGKLDKYYIMMELHHTEASVNALLASVSRGDSPPLRVDDFRDGVRLLTLKQTAKILGTTVLTLRTKKHKRFSGLYIGCQWRFADRTIYSYLVRRDNYVTREDVMRIFSCSQRVTQRWERAGLLEPVQVRDTGSWKYYYLPADVMRVIQHCLPLKMRGSADQWLFEACVSPEPPLTTSQVVSLLGLARRELLAMTNKGWLFYLSLEGNRPNRRFSRVSVERALLNQKPWTPQDIGNVIGAESTQVAAWLNSELACLVHNHIGLEYRYACMVAIVTPLLSPGIAARHWIARRQKKVPRPLFTMGEVAKHYGVTVGDVAFLAESSTLGGLRRPDGVWVFTESQLRMNHTTFKRQLTARP